MVSGSLQTSGGVRPARGVPTKVEEDGSAEKVRRCSACLKRAVSATMWTCGSGKELCRGMTFHRKCLARGKRESCSDYGRVQL